jgi:glycosyltransferase involved in cell wall biosynthesis
MNTRKTLARSVENFSGMPTSLSVIFSTYNQPDWLEKAFWGWACQADRDFEIIVADDGSGPRTRACIENARAQTGLNIQHVWQPDAGFQKSAVLNKAILAASGDYLVFTDGDCIPRRDFVAVHRQRAEPGRFLSGGYTKLPLTLSQSIARDDVESGRAFDAAWLRQRGWRGGAWSKPAVRGALAMILNAFTPTKPTWNGHNASGWKTDLLRVNGFNEQMQYGGQDRELGERLINLGLRGKHVRYHAIVLHLDHPRGYATEESKSRNRQIRNETVRCKLTWTPHGILKQQDPPAELSEQPTTRR